MSKLIKIQDREEMDRFGSSTGYAEMTSDQMKSQQVDAHLIKLESGSRVSASCSLWWQSTPAYPPGHRLGVIGHYAADADESAAVLIKGACRHLAAQGCSYAIGPMEGNTWRKYRMITQRGSEPVFFLEPDNPDSWPFHFLNAGFAPIATYFSALNTGLKYQTSKFEALEKHLVQAGIHIRSIRLDPFKGELAHLYPLVSNCFKDNFLFTPLPESEFITTYHSLKPYIDPELALIVEHAGRPVGFVLGIPDILQLNRKSSIDTMILKTLAVHPGYRGCGLGHLLIAKCRSKAMDAGFSRLIFALIKTDNVSGKISSHYARPIRKYSLFGRRII